MKQVMSFLLLLMVATGCSWFKTNPVGQAIVTAAQGTICPLGQQFADTLGSQLATATGASNPLACGAALYTPLVNSGLCTQPVPASASLSAAGKAMLAANPQWKTIADIPKSALGTPGGKAVLDAVKMQGIISSIVCPLGVGVIIGVASAQIPPACQGPTPLSASTLDQDAVTVCQTITAPLP